MAKTEITERIEAYAPGRPKGWAALRDWLVGHKYVAPVRYNDPQPGPTEERDWETEYPYPGSFDEVKAARDIGLLTRDEYGEVSRAIDER